MGIKINYTTISISVIILLVIALSIQSERAKNLKTKKEVAEEGLTQAIKFSKSTEGELTVYKNKYGYSVLRVEQLQLSHDNLEKLRHTERLKFLNQFEKLKKDLRNLEQAGVFQWELEEDSIPMTVTMLPCKDSIKVFRYTLKDEFNDIEAMVIDTPRFDIRVPVYYVDFWERKWFLGRKKWYRESSSPNRLIKLEAQSIVTIQRRN